MQVWIFVTLAFVFRGMESRQAPRRVESTEIGTLLNVLPRMRELLVFVVNSTRVCCNLYFFDCCNFVQTLISLSALHNILHS